MGIRTVEEHLRSLRDDRVVFFKGQRVSDVTSHPVLGIGARHASLDFQLAEDPAFQQLMTYIEPATGERCSRFFKLPESAEDLLRRRLMIETSTREGAGLVLLVKEIGTDALFALHAVARRLDAACGTSYRERVAAYHAACRDHDWSMAVAQSDVKGDRSLRPSQQAHPDYYLHIVEERPDGIVVRGAKAHTSHAPYVNEIIVLPTRALGEADRAYAVAFAVPAATPGLRFIGSPFSAAATSTFHHPLSAEHKMIETVTVFDNVLVPWERVFMKGEHQFAGDLANSFVEYHRFTAVSYKTPWLELMLGAADLMAEYNGIERAAHVREKLSALVGYLEAVRALIQQAALGCRPTGAGTVAPDSVLTNIAKCYFATHYHQMVSYVQDIAGGLLVTGPSEEDWLNPETHADLEHYLGGKAGVSTEARLRLLNFIRDMCASDYGGYHEILNLHAEGGLEAQKMTILRNYDRTFCRDVVKRFARLA